MICKECGEKLTATVRDNYFDEDTFVEIDFECSSDHSFFARIQPDDLIEND